MFQPSTKRGGGGRSAAFALGAARVDPAKERLLLLGTEAGIVGELAMFGVGVPGRHPALGNHLADHGRPACRFRVTGQRQRPDFSGPVTGLAVTLEDGGYITAIGGGALFLLLVPGDQAARRSGSRLANRSAGKQVIQGIDKIIAGGPRTMSLNVVLIVDATPVANDSLGIQNEHFRRALGAKAIGDGRTGIAQERKSDVVLLAVSGQGTGRVLGVAVDADKGDAARFIGAGQLNEARPIEPGQRALDAEEHHDDNPALAEVTETEVPTATVAQCEIIDGPGHGAAQPQQQCQRSNRMHGKLPALCRARIAFFGVRRVISCAVGGPTGRYLRLDTAGTAGPLTRRRQACRGWSAARPGCERGRLPGRQRRYPRLMTARPGPGWPTGRRLHRLHRRSVGQGPDPDNAGP